MNVVALPAAAALRGRGVAIPVPLLVGGVIAS